MAATIPSAHRLVPLVLSVAGVALAGCGGGSALPRLSPTPTPVRTTAKPTASPTPTPGIPATFAGKYAAIHNGMTIDDVRTLMGSDGTPLSQSDNGGTTSVVLEWRDPKTGHSIIVAFINSIVQSKSAIGF